MPLAEWICIRPGDAGTLTLIANKCSIVRNAPRRMNIHMHRPRHPSSSPIWAPPPLPAHLSPLPCKCHTMPIRLEVHVRGTGFKVAVDGVYAYQTSFGLASGQVLCRRQVWTQGIESVEQMCDTRSYLLKSRTLRSSKGNLMHLI
jgi:hypothetical protein